MDMTDPMKYINWMEEQVAGKPANVRAFLEHMYERAVDITEELARVPDADLSLSAYTGGAQPEMHRMFESLLRKAAADPEQFIYNFHEEMTEVSRAIRENSLYAQFLDFAGAVSRVCPDLAEDGNAPETKVYTSYAWLVLMTCHYLSPSEYDLTRMLCGCSSDGEPLFCDTYYPYAADVRARAFAAWEDPDVWDSDEGQLELDEYVERYAAETGYTDITTNDELCDIIEADDRRKEMIGRISPFINEYTYDMIPDTEHVYRMDTSALERLEARSEPSALAESLPVGSRTLPMNGIRCDFSPDPRFPADDQLQELTLKEASRGDRVVLLYRLRFSGQDICGYYDPEDRFFFPPFLTDEEDEFGQALNTRICSLVLYLYRAASAPDGGRMLLELGDRFRLLSGPGEKTGFPVFATSHPLGWVPRDTYRSRRGPAGRP